MRSLILIGLLMSLSSCAHQEEALVFSSARSGSGDIYVLRNGEPSETVLIGSETGEGNPLYDRRRMRIVYQAFNDTRVELRSEGVFLIEDPNGDAAPDWSPTTDEIIYSAQRDGTEHIYAFDLMSRVERQLTDEDATDRYPVYAPDGSQISFARKTADGWRLMILDLASGRTTALTDSLPYLGHPSWSPDSTKIAFDVLIDRQAEIAYALLGQVGITRLTDRPGNDLKPAWSLDSERIVFGSDAENSDWDIYEVDLETRVVTKLVSSPGFDGSAIYVPESAVESSE